MIRYLHGVIKFKIRTQLILDVQGVGYGLVVTPETLASAVIGESAEFHISESIREDAHDLYGFRTQAERESFDLLRKVSGVGPKAALAICGFYTPTDLSVLIQANDSAKLSLVPGIGAKLAGKIVLELKGKVSIDQSSTGETADVDTIEALESLGYNRAEIIAILKKIPASLATTSERVTWVLRHMAGD